MPARNLKSVIMGRNREGITRAVTREHPSLAVAFALLNQWLSFTTLSRKNILWAAKHVQTLREHTDWINDIPSQEKLDRLDQAVAAAKERLQRREEKRARIKAEAEPKGPKADRRFRPTTLAPPAPPQDPADIWAAILEEKKS